MLCCSYLCMSLDTDCWLAFSTEVDHCPCAQGTPDACLTNEACPIRVATAPPPQLEAALSQSLVVPPSPELVTRRVEAESQPPLLQQHQASVGLRAPPSAA